MGLGLARGLVCPLLDIVNSAVTELRQRSSPWVSLPSHYEDHPRANRQYPRFTRLVLTTSERSCIPFPSGKRGTSLVQGYGWIASVSLQVAPPSRCHSDCAKCWKRRPSRMQAIFWELTEDLL
uniref:Putative salivary secreted peptide n=1 Tax=Ixodes pacificus TaxID=29930 RepID=Q6B888_IXOPA|nr:putative salivary secreted peptide [Ixodes pacificus]